MTDTAERRRAHADTEQMLEAAKAAPGIVALTY